MAKTKQKKDTRSSRRRKIDTAIIVALIGLAGTVISVLIPQIFPEQTQPPPPPTVIPLTSTATPIPPTDTPIPPTLTPVPTTPTPTSTYYVAFKNFTILKDGQLPETVVADGTTSVAAGSRIAIRANIASNIVREDLFFIWVICSQQGQIEGHSVFEIPYQAPDARETDCVRVMVKKRDIVLIPYTTIYVDVH